MTIQRFRTVHTEQIIELPDGRLKKDRRELSRRDSNRLRAIIGYDDGAMPEHIGVESLLDGREIIWRIEDGERAGVAWLPADEDDPDARKADDLIAAHVKPDDYNGAPDAWRLKERNVPVWMITGSLTPEHDTRTMLPMHIAFLVRRSMPRGCTISVRERRLMPGLRRIGSRNGVFLPR